VFLVANERNVRRMATTDASGRYEFAQLPEGRYIVSASKGGFVSLQYGQRRPFEPGKPVAVGADEVVERIEIGLPRGSAISGRVTDEFGEPLTGAQVDAQRYQYGPGGERALNGVGAFGTSDDRGEFRVYGLMPGEYVLSASLSAPVNINLDAATGSTEGFPPTFYPGTSNPAEAEAIRVGLGEETTVTFALRAARTARISGTVVDSQGRPGTGASVMFESFAGGYSQVRFGGVVGSDGSFSLANVPAGEHLIQVRGVASGPESLPEWANVPVTVTSGDLNGLRIVMQRPGVVSGTVVFEGTSPRTGGSAPLMVIATPATPQRQGTGVFDSFDNGRVDPDGNFEIRGVTGSVLLRAIALPPAWMMKSATLDGDDVADAPLNMTTSRTVTGVRVVLTDRVTDLSGTVTDDRGESLKEYAVVIVPADERRGWAQTRYVRVPRPDQDGRFRVRGLPQGRYYAVAVESLEQGREWDPAFQQIARDSGRNFTLTEGETLTLALKMTNTR